MLKREVDILLGGGPGGGPGGSPRRLVDDVVEADGAGEGAVPAGAGAVPPPVWSSSPAILKNLNGFLEE